jgi:hypothetical protein
MTISLSGITTSIKLALGTVLTLTKNYAASLAISGFVLQNETTL